MTFFDSLTKSRYLILSLIILLSIGTIFIYSSSSFLGYYHYQNNFHFYSKQLTGSFICLFLVYILSYVPINFFHKYQFLFFVFSIACNIILFLPFFHHSVHGAIRWLKLGPLLFQPSEFLKISYILHISNLFSNYYDQTNHIFLYLFISSIITMTILLFQSDFGSTIILCGITFFLLWDFLYRKKILIYLLLISLSGFLLLIITKPYRILRILTFLNPWQDPSGSGYQTIQSLIAIHNGNLFGLGLGFSKQKNLFLPMPHTDFIFSIIIEEWGILGGIILLGGLLTFASLFIHLATKNERISDKYYLLGLGLLLSFQTIINTGGATLLLPVKGIGLPFISYGLSSLIGFGIALGIAISIIREKEKD